MKQILAVAKEGKNAETSTNPNDFIFHSSYNTLKIISTGSFTADLEKSVYTESDFQYNHGLGYIPFLVFFWQDKDGEVHLPGGLSNDKGLFIDAIMVDKKVIYIWYFNTSNNPHRIIVKYYEFEIPLI